MSDANVDPITLELMRNLFEASADEMGITLQRVAFSANIKERRDFSCAIFDSGGALLAQAAHIPVHLGSMGDSVRAVLEKLGTLADGDVAIVNDPFAGGTHLPDITLVAPVFYQGTLAGYVANRAHHADVGGISPGSMTLSRHIDEEGIRIEPAFLQKGGVVQDELLNRILKAVRTPDERLGDLDAQLAANRIDALPDGEYRFDDVLDDDGTGYGPVAIRAVVTIKDDRATVDLTGCDNQVAGCVNCPASVARAAVYYCFACLLEEHVPLNGGCFRNIDVIMRPGSVVHAQFPAAVVAGNTETSQRVVDVVFGALAKALPEKIPAASCGTMSSVAIGGEGWTYYETIGGGSGASPDGDGASAVQCHMTNTLNTPAEAIEMQYPLRVRRFERAPGSGGAGKHRGGDGIVREIEALTPAEGTVITDRRVSRPYGLHGGAAASSGANSVNGQPVGGKAKIKLSRGDVLRIVTPGGGGWGS
jgi:N-methylhydantoinase B